MNPDEIRRLITNQKHEHVPHAFRAGGDGMDAFRRLHPVLRSLPPGQLRRWLRSIDAMAASHHRCLPCASKILAFQIHFTRDRLPELHEMYVARYRSLQLAHRPDDRDYLEEVTAHLAGLEDSPAAENNYRSWRAQVLKLQLENRAGRE